MIRNLCTQRGTNIKDHRAAARSHSAWKTGSTLRVFFMDGDVSLHEEAMLAARQWSEYANVKFEQSSDALSEIRVTFNCDGAWSFVGNEALGVSNQEATMCLSHLNYERDAAARAGITMHEFGHALGLIHEHLSPTAVIPWDEQKVMKYYRENFGWDDDSIRSNVLDKPSGVDLFTEFDDKSIMLYPVAKELTTNGFEIPWQNYVLSEIDKLFIKQLYPRGDFR
jgi:hypothetical protein